MSHIHFARRPHYLHEQIRQAFRPILADGDVEAANSATPTWVPRVDIREEAERFVLLADLPGVDPEAIEVQMDKGVLSISGTRAANETQEGERYSHRERVHGDFKRRFALPDSADAEGIRATGRHGVLEIVIPKRPESAPRRIQVQ